MKYSRMRFITANVKNTILSITRSLLIFGASMRNKNTQENSKLQSILLRSIYSYCTQNSWRCRNSINRGFTRRIRSDDEHNCYGSLPAWLIQETGHWKRATRPFAHWFESSALHSALVTWGQELLTTLLHDTIALPLEGNVSRFSSKIGLD